MIDLVDSCSLLGKNVISNFIEPTLGEYDYCKKVIKKNLNKNLVVSEKDEQLFQSINKCYICIICFRRQ